jgi:hypothetical protein
MYMYTPAYSSKQVKPDLVSKLYYSVISTFSTNALLTINPLYDKKKTPQPDSCGAEEGISNADNGCVRFYR